MNRLFLSLIVALLGAGLLSTCAAGQIAICVLDIEPGVRSLGMGGAAVALADGAETFYYNPAGLAKLDGISFSSFYAYHLGLSNYSALDLTFPNWGLGLLMLNSGGITGYDAGGSPTGTLSYGSYAVLFGFGVDPRTIPFIPALPIDFSLGGQIKYLSVTSAEARGSGFSFDLAYWMDFFDMRLGPIALTDIGLGITATNLFGAVNYDGYSEAFRMDLCLGGSMRIAGVVLLAADLELTGSFHLGAEYRPIETFAVRTGILTQAGAISLTLGLGLDVEGFIIDYAYISHPTLPGSHRVSLTIDFSGIDLAAIGRSLRRILP